MAVIAKNALENLWQADAKATYASVSGRSGGPCIDIFT